jgi:hypothetical protein
MKIPFTIILFLGTMTAFSQNNSKNSDKWKVGVTFSPDNYLNSSNISLTQDIGFGSVSLSRFNFTSGLSAEWSFNSNIDIGSGINYSRKDFSGTFYCNECLWVFPPEPESIKLRFIEVPVFIRYNFFDKKIDLHVEAGLTGGYLINKFSSRYGGTPPANKFQLGGQVGLGVSLDLGQRINLSLSSDFRQSFTNLLVDSNFKFRSVGFTTGIMYKIN